MSARLRLSTSSRPDLAAALLGHEVPQVGGGVAERRVLGELGLAHRHQSTGQPGPVDVTRGQPPGLQERRRQQHPVVARVRPSPATPPAARRPRRIHVPRRVESLRLISWTRPDRRSAAASSPRATRSFSATASASSSDRGVGQHETRTGRPVERGPVGVFVLHGHDLHVVYRLGAGRVVVQDPQQEPAVGPQRPDRRPERFRRRGGVVAGRRGRRQLTANCSVPTDLAPPPSPQR